MLTMKDMDEVIKAIGIGFIVANFLLTTCRVVKAIELCKECLFILSQVGLKEERLDKRLYKGVYLTMLKAYFLINDYKTAIKYGRKLLHIHRNCGEKLKECNLSLELAILFIHQSQYAEAKEICEKALLISTEIGDRKSEAICYENLGTVYKLFGKYQKAKEYYEKMLAVRTEICDRKGEAACYEQLGTVYQSLGEYNKAREFYEKALAIRKEFGDKNGEGIAYENLGTVYHYLGDYVKAKEYVKTALTIHKNTGYKKLEALSYGNLGALHQSLGEYEKARECIDKALSIYEEFGDKKGKALSYGNLGVVFQSVGNYEKARQCHEKALALHKEIGDINGEGTAYGHLGALFYFLSNYSQSEMFLKRALAIKSETGDRNGIASSYANLGRVYKVVGKFEKAIECHKKALEIEKKIGARKEEACSYMHLGTVYRSIGEYEKAREHHEKALMIGKEIGDRKGVASSYASLGMVFQLLGEYSKAREYHEKSLALRIKIGDKSGEATDHGNLGSLFQSLGKYAKANEHLQRALEIQKEIEDRQGEASSYGSLGHVFLSLGDYVKAKEYCEKALTISKEIGDSEGEAAHSANLGTVFKYLGEYWKAEEYQKKGLAISEKIGDVEKQYEFLCKLASVKFSQGADQEALSYLHLSIQKCEELRSFLRNNDQFKISFSDKHVFPYWILSKLMCLAGNHNEALQVSELGRARALADLMSAQYSVENEISDNPQSWVSIESIMKKEPNSTCLYASYTSKDMFLWTLKTTGVVHFQNIAINKMIVPKGMARNLNEFFVKQSFGISAEERCEDRSLDGIQRKPKSSEDGDPASYQIVMDSKGKQDPELNLPLCYKLIIAPVAAFFEDPEIIIVPERSLYNIPFAALPDEKGKYLSETFRIRVVPSLTTLRLIHDSPADYHSQTGALIVGNPDVGKVHYMGRLRDISRLACAEQEAKMIGEKLGVKPLLGQQATKQAVLQVINSASLIHFAAHGNRERGEIALAPPPHPPDKIPQEEDYLLTMYDISKVQLRAKLVVLSCCHSGRGHIRTEGVVGIARAFLGSGARSVLVALWALDDSATELFMSCFYEHLVRGDSASESLHEAMKWMRCNGYSDVRQWAPFMLIGDNVTFKCFNKTADQ